MTAQRARRFRVGATSTMPADTREPDDSAMMELLAKWGKDVRALQESGTVGGDPSRRALFEPPQDLSRLHAALDAVDAELIRRPQERSRRVPFLAFRRTTLAVAASIALLIGGWLAREALLGRRQPRILATIALSDMQLTVTPGRVRDAEPPAFRSGDALFVHFQADRDGFVSVALLDGAGQLRVLPGAESIPVMQGSNTLSSRVLLDETAGQETVFLLGSAARLTPDELSALVRDADTGDAPSKVHGDRVQDLTARLQAGGNVSVLTLTYDHRSR